MVIFPVGECHSFLIEERSRKMSEFKTYHPIVNFTYFVLVIGFSCYFFNPVCLGISLCSAFLHYMMLRGRDKALKSLLYMIPMLVMTAVINLIFNHQGITVISYLPSGNPLTFEAVIYGICASLMLLSVICHFSCYSKIMSSDKFIYLFGKIIPSMSLIISMTLRFVPRFLRELKEISRAQRCIGRDMGKGSLISRLKNGLSILSIMTTRALENAVETADSMNARGYGVAGRTAYSIYTFEKRDRLALVAILLLGGYTLLGAVMGWADFSFFPAIKSAELSPLSISVFVAYLLLSICPLIIEIREVIRWKALRSKI